MSMLSATLLGEFVENDLGVGETACRLENIAVTVFVVACRPKRAHVSCGSLHAVRVKGFLYGIGVPVGDVGWVLV